MKELSSRFRAKLVLIEDRASGVQLIQDLRQERVYNLKAVSPKGDKILRLRDQTAMMEAGFVHFPERAPWLDDLIPTL